MEYASRILEEAVDEISLLPGIGRKTALRLALHLVRRGPEASHRLANALEKMGSSLKHCQICHNISDDDTCAICAHPGREKNILCVVEDIRDVMAIESTSQFKGLYHVLGGLISPLDGVGPAELQIESLVDRVENQGIAEVLFALGATVEGDSTSFYIFRKLQNLPIKITAISRGIGVGDQLEYADEATLGRSIRNRVLFEDSIRS
jgi:recombination protein RecR